MRLRFPDVRARAAHYESVYVVLSHPSEPRAVWIRTTVRKRPGEPPNGALWVTWFGKDGVRAGKLDTQPVAVGEPGIVVGDAIQGPGGSRGRIDLPTLAASWDVTFTARTPYLEHLHPHRLYAAPLPRTKSTSPVPDLDVHGSLVIDGESVDLTGWTGMVGHNWGSEHAARWIWLRVAGLGDDGSGWLDAVLGRVRVGPVLVPWTGFGALALPGRDRIPLGGLLNRGTRVELGPDGATITLTGAGATVTTTARVSLAASVGWEYADPAGGRHEVVNCSVAQQRVEVTEAGRTASYEPQVRGVLEVGGDERAFAVDLQPYAD
jgi:hypothetical protein